jgi:cyclic pyranopterin phosphate synthase
MPLGGLPLKPRDELLTASELEAVVRAALAIGFRKFRLTGGEPTLRQDIIEIVERLSRLNGVADLSMTTNAVRLADLAAPLARAGLRRVNLHVDSLDAERLAGTMRLATLAVTEAGLCAALEAGFSPVKLNCVVTRGYNDEDVVSLAERALTHGWHARFIELMPLGQGQTARVAHDAYVPTVETRARIEATLGPLSPLEGSAASDGARNFRAPGRSGVIGFISPVSEPYCGTCNRMRLTADGKLHLCLLRDEQIDIRALLSAGAPQEALSAALLRAVRHKPSGHLLAKDLSTRDREMYQIGG